jgi:hypothetical protein
MAWIGQVRKVDTKQQELLDWNVTPDALPGSTTIGLLAQ